MRPIAVLLAAASLAAACSPAGGVAPVATPSAEPSPSPSPSAVPDARWAFVALGDWGTGLRASDRVARRMCRWRRNHPYEDVVTTGDNVYPDGDPDDFREKFFEPHECSLSHGVEWHSSLGNHDVLTDGGGPQLDEPRFGMPRRNYVFRKEGVRFVVADSNDLSMRWLRRRTRPREGDRWTIVVFHHPVYSGGTGHGPEPGLAAKVTELFNRRGVDLVLNGHDHVYSVTKPISGTRYVVTGGGGASTYDCRSAVSVVRCESRHHFLYVTVGRRALRVYAVPPTGPPFHSFRTFGISP